MTALHHVLASGETSLQAARQLLLPNDAVLFRHSSVNSP